MSNFLPLGDAKVRMAVLEEKLTVYEDLSREMLSKLESAVDKISEANQNVAKILVRHEERLDQTAASDAAMLRLIEDHRAEVAKSLEKIEKALDDEKSKADKKFSTLFRILWISWGVILTVGAISSELKPISRLLSAPAHHPQPPLSSVPHK